SAARSAGEEPYQPLNPGDLPRPLMRRWQRFLSETRRKHHPVLAPWHAFAALPQKDFAVRAPAVAARVAANADAQYSINPLVAQAFGGKPPASLREVAQRYNELLAWVDKRWQQAVQQAKEHQVDPPAALSDPIVEELRQLLYAPESPCALAPQDTERFLNT